VNERLRKAVHVLPNYQHRYAHEGHSSLTFDILAGLKHAVSSRHGCTTGDVFNLTVQQHVNMHVGKIQTSKNDRVKDKQDRDEIGAHQGFWPFDVFF
jgi:hypothetical protein